MSLFHHHSPDITFTISLWKFTYTKPYTSCCPFSYSSKLGSVYSMYMCVVVVCYLFCTMIMAIQSEGYTCFPIRSLKSRKDSIRKSWSEIDIRRRMIFNNILIQYSLRQFGDICRSVCTYHKIICSTEGFYVCSIVTIIHLTEDSCHAGYHPGLWR